MAEEVQYGPDIPGESELRLLGDVRKQRVLQLGCRSTQAGVALARAGALVIAVDDDVRRLDRLREACEHAEVRSETRHTDIAELAFLRSDSIDAVLSIYALGRVDDLDRVLRQVHRVLKAGRHVVISLPHPAYAMLDRSLTPPRIGRRYFDASPGHDEPGPATQTVSALFGGLERAGFRVDTLLEPEPVPAAPRSHQWSDAMQDVPGTLIVRARKEGV